MPALRCAVAPATDMNLETAAIDGTDGRTDGQTPVSYIDPAPHTVHAGSVSDRFSKPASFLITMNLYNQLILCAL